MTLDRLESDVLARALARYRATINVDHKTRRPPARQPILFDEEAATRTERLAAIDRLELRFGLRRQRQENP